MRVIRKTWALLCAVIIFVSLFGAFSPQTVKASNGSLSITTSATSVISGKEITVTVKLDYPDKGADGQDVGINVCQFEFRYNSDNFEYVSGDAPGSGYDGLIMMYSLEMEMPTSLTWTFKFRAKNVGTSAFTITSGTFVNGDLEEFYPIGTGISSPSVKVMAVGSDDATLNSLQIAGTSLSPAFSKATTSYTAYVDNSITSVRLAATATQGGKVEISGNYNNLSVGKNVVTITSYAPNGATMKYTVTIVRLEPPTEPPTPAPTEPPTDPIDDVNITIDGESYVINSSYSVDLIPQGFVADLDTYKGKDVLVAVNSQLDITLMYLMNSEQIGAFYVYDKDTESFNRFVRIDTGTRKYILLNGENRDDKPRGYELTETEAMGVKFLAYVNSKNPDFAYFYAISSEGVKSWYCLDCVEKTIQRVNSFAFSDETEEVTTGETEPVITIEDTASDIISSLNEANNDLINDNAQLKKIQFMVYIIGGALITILVIFIVVILCNRSARKIEDEPDLAELDVDENVVIDDAVVETAVTEETASTKENAATEEVLAEENTATEEVLAEENAVNEENVSAGEDTVIEETIQEIDVTEITKEEQDAFDREASSEPMEETVLGSLVSDIKSIMDDAGADEDTAGDDDGIEMIDTSDIDDETFL